MISCKDFLRELNDYLDETVDPSTKLHLQTHVEECLNCYVIVDTTKKTMQVYKGSVEQELPLDVKSRLMRALEKKMASRKFAP